MTRTNAELAHDAAGRAIACGLSIYEWVEMKCVEGPLVDQHTKPSDALPLHPFLLLDRLRHDELEEGPERRRARNVALLYGRYVGETPEESSDLYDRYVALLEAGKRP